MICTKNLTPTANAQSNARARVFFASLAAGSELARDNGGPHRRTYRAPSSARQALPGSAPWTPTLRGVAAAAEMARRENASQGVPLDNGSDRRLSAEVRARVHTRTRLGPGGTGPRVTAIHRAGNVPDGGPCTHRSRKRSAFPPPSRRETRSYRVNLRGRLVQIRTTRARR